ncbi:hypothetical protein [Nonomuraea lactucae]|uniref:hypothetical protein n=1 Tax=Nonomuraea lactucae TaxID=2249762 RepID=UPI0013B3CE67|nr:hypothetical protein [Nonomuraea lactucae]
MNCELSGLDKCVSDMQVAVEKSTAQAAAAKKDIDIYFNTSGWGLTEGNYKWALARARGIAQNDESFWRNVENNLSPQLVAPCPNGCLPPRLNMAQAVKHFDIIPERVTVNVKEHRLFIGITNIDTQALPAWAIAVIVDAVAIVVPMIAIPLCLAAIPELPAVCAGVGGAASGGISGLVEASLSGEDLRDIGVIAKIIAKTIAGALLGVSARYLDKLLTGDKIVKIFKRGGYTIREMAKAWWVPNSLRHGVVATGDVLGNVAAPVSENLRHHFGVG